MRFQARIPRFVTSTVEAGPERATPILDGRDAVVPNHWKLPPNTVALVGRPAVSTSLDLTLPSFSLGPVRVRGRRLRFEQDFGGHLFIVLTTDEADRVRIVEGGPLTPGGAGNLVPYSYPEDDFARRGVIDFEPVVIPPPNGLAEGDFLQLLRDVHRAYDGDQRYRAIEIPFLRVGRDSNSYAVGVLLCCGIDPRAIPKPQKAMRWEWTGYPGAEDPVHHANFGAYLGAPTHLAGGVLEVAYHNWDGSVRLVAVGGEPAGVARLPDGSEARLDAQGRIVFLPEEAKRRGLPSRHTEPPRQIAARRRFPPDPAPAGAQITLVVDGRSVPLEPGNQYRGAIVDRNDALGLAILRTADGVEVVLPLTELGVELRDPKRVDELMRVGVELTVGLHSDRHPKLVAHGDAALIDRFRARRLHAPRPANVAGAAALGIGLLVAVAGYFVWRRTKR